MKEFKVGLQLYSVRDYMEKDMDSTLKAVKEMGYDYVEFAGYFGKSAKEVKTLLDKYALKCISVHQKPDIFVNEGQKAVDYLKTIGAEFCAIPWYNVDEYKNNWHSTVELFKNTGKLLYDNGIQMLYHNHDFEFEKIDGEYIIDKLYREIPENLMQPQFDTCWIHYAGENPADYLRKYSSRIKVVHLKDFVCEKFGGGPVYELIGNDKNKSREENGFKFKSIGSGIQNWEKILNACEDTDAEILIVEQDRSYDKSSLDEAKNSRIYLKENFGI